MACPSAVSNRPPIAKAISWSPDSRRPNNHVDRPRRANGSQRGQSNEKLGIRRYHMNTCWDYQLSAVHIGAERFSHLLDERIAPLGR